MSARDYLRTARAQTAAVEGAGFPLAAYLGGAPLWTLPLFALLGILSHFGGFGENGLTDLAYDRLDPSKADHPVVSGRLPFRRAFAFVYVCQAAGIALFAALLALARPSDWPLAVGLFAGYVLLGHAYNLLGKAWKPGAVLEISGAFMLAFLACGSVWTGSLTPLLWLVGVYAFAMVAFQIAVAGDLKEIERPNESNLLRRLGAVVWSDGRFSSGVPVLLFALALTLAKAFSLQVVGWQVAGSWWGLAVYIVAFLILWGYAMLLLSRGPFNRLKRLRIMGAGEAASYLLLVLAVAPLLGWWLSALFVLLPVAWFAGMNRLLWARTGSAWAPGV